MPFFFRWEMGGNHFEAKKRVFPDEKSEEGIFCWELVF